MIAHMPMDRICNMPRGELVELLVTKAHDDTGTIPDEASRAMAKAFAWFAFLNTPTEDLRHKVLELFGY